MYVADSKNRPIVADRDSGLIRDCAELAALCGRFAALDYDAECGSAAELARQKAIRSLSEQERIVARRICQARAQSWAGLKSRAVLLRGWPTEAQAGWIDDTLAQSIASALIRDMAAVGAAQ